MDIELLFKVASEMWTVTIVKRLMLYSQKTVTKTLNLLSK